MCECTLLATNRFTPIFIKRDVFQLRLVQSDRSDVLCGNFVLEGEITQATVKRTKNGYQITLERT